MDRGFAGRRQTLASTETRWRRLLMSEPPADGGKPFMSEPPGEEVIHTSATRTRGEPVSHSCVVNQETSKPLITEPPAHKVTQSCLSHQETREPAHVWATRRRVNYLCLSHQETRLPTYVWATSRQGYPLMCGPPVDEVTHSCLSHLIQFYVWTLRPSDSILLGHE
jgi:hypothetical protein